MNALERLRALVDRGRARAVGRIGLWPGWDGLHLVQLEGGAGRTSIRAARSLPWPGARDRVLDSRAELSRLVREALSSRPFRGRRAVSALAAPDVKLMVLGYALQGEANEPQRILRLVEERVEEPLENLVVDYLPIRLVGEDAAERSALVAVAPRARVIEHLERFRHAGLEIDALEILPVAVRRLVQRMTGESTDENCIALFCGRERSHLAVLWGRRLILYREVEFGERQAIEEVGKALELEPEDAAALIRRYGVRPPEPGGAAEEDPAEALEVGQTLMEILKPTFYALAEHVERSVVYIASKSRGASPEQVYLLGAMARWPRADALLEALTSIPVRALDARRAFPVGPKAASEADLEAAGGVALAAGLALRDMQVDG